MMQPLVQLITAWQQYTEQFAHAGVEDFCYNYLLNNKRQQESASNADLLLAKQLGKTNSILKTYYKLALRQIPGVELDWYYFMDAIAEAGELRKTDIVSFNLLLEPTTGIDVLNRMLKADLISERIDPADKRARLIRLSADGHEILARLNVLFAKITSIVLASIEADDKTMMGTALTVLVNKQNNMMQEGRQKGIENMESAIINLVKNTQNDTKPTFK